MRQRRGAAPSFLGGRVPNVPREGWGQVGVRPVQHQRGESLSRVPPLGQPGLGGGSRAQMPTLAPGEALSAFSAEPVGPLATSVWSEPASFQMCPWAPW